MAFSQCGNDRNHKFVLHQFNCNGLLSSHRLAELKSYVYSEQPDVICLSETFIKTKTREPKFLGYHEPYSKYREHAERGGLSIVIRETIEYRPVNLVPYNGGCLECQAVSLNSELGKVDILNIYNPHKVVTKEEYIFYLRQLNSNFVMVGDFNSHSILWEYDGQTNSAGRELEKLLNDACIDICLLNDEFMKTYIDSRTGSASCLDLCFCSSNLVLQGEIMRERDLGSDHFPIKSTFGLKLIKTPILVKQRWKYKEANWKTYQTCLKDDTYNSVWPTDASKANSMLTERVTDAAKISVPQTSGKKTYNLTVHGMTAECRQAIRDRGAAKGRLFRSPTPENLELVKLHENRAKWKVKNGRQGSWREFIGTIDCETSNSEMWQKVSCIRRGKVFCPVYPVGAHGLTLKDRANLFVDHFTKNNNVIGDRDGEINDLVDGYLITNCNDSVIPFTCYEMNDAMRYLKNKSPGPDDIHDSFLKNLPEILKTDLFHLFNISWHSRSVPDDWKVGETCPIPKPGRDSTLATSYRPICMLSTVGKLMERMVQRRMEHYLESNFMLNSAQYGFRQEKSTVDALLVIKNSIRESLDANQFCIVVHLDIQGAFDCVWHKGLLYKMIALGFDHPTVEWINSYLTNRRIKVRLGNTNSDEKLVTCGVPQGAVLSPILFNMMLYDIPMDDDVQFVSYADDVTLTVSGNDMASTAEKMQTYLDRLHAWFTQWHFTLNPLKCSTQIFTKKRRYDPVDMLLDMTVIPRTQNKMLLGLIFDSPKLTFNAHVLYLKDTCKRRTNVMKAISSKSFGCSRNTLRRIYIAFIRSKLEYASAVFCPLKEKQIQILEVVQNNNLRIILGARQTSPILSMQVEAYIPPILLRFDYLLVKWLIKLKHRGSNDRTVDVLKLNVNNNPLPSEFARVSKYVSTLLTFPPLLQTQTEIVSPLSPWIDISDNIELGLPIDRTLPTEINGAFNEYISVKYPNYICIYTDGSKLDDGSTSAALFVPSIKKAMSWLLPSSRSVVGSELYAIWKSLQFVNASGLFKDRRILILSDSMSALQMINTKHKPSYKHLIYKIHTELEKKHVRIVKFQWVKSHCGIRYNDVADLLAREAHSNDRSTLIKL